MLSLRIAGDGGRPVCRTCTERHVQCGRPEPQRRFVVYTTDPATSQLAQQAQDVTAVAETTTLAADYQTPAPKEVDGKHGFQITDPRGPTEDLLNMIIASPYNHYVEDLAAWYDLCEHDRPFESLVPIRALGCPVVFNAVIAFSAQHKALHDPRYETCSMLYHGACVKGLLSGLDAFDPSMREDSLVAACLLRSYEILKADSRQEQRHLLGAYRFWSTEDIDMSNTGLLQAGVWNYLREEITVALECQRSVRLNVHVHVRTGMSQSESMHANAITYILARVINHCFAKDDTNRGQFDNDEWMELNALLIFWKDNLPPTYKPYSRAPRTGNPFPSKWYLRQWHIAAVQYYLTAKTLLLLHNPCTKLELTLVERLCGIAYTNQHKAARVNAFGLTAVCGRHLKFTLLSSSREVGWPVHRIIDDLGAF